MIQLSLCVVAPDFNHNYLQFIKRLRADLMTTAHTSQQCCKPVQSDFKCEDCAGQSMQVMLVILEYRIDNICSVDGCCHP